MKIPEKLLSFVPLMYTGILGDSLGTEQTNIFFAKS